ncbi:MAG: phenylacetate--CoA ligase family protein, partial [Bacteroidota bacterium]
MSAFIPDIETKSPQEIQLFQEKKLTELLAYVNTHSDFYKLHFKNNGIDIGTINTLQDLAKIPVTTKDDLHHYNSGFICVSPEHIIDYVTTSGTMGDPLTFVLT